MIRFSIQVCNYLSFVKLALGVVQRISPSRISMLLDHSLHTFSYQYWELSSSLVPSWSHDYVNCEGMNDQVSTTQISYSQIGFQFSQYVPRIQPFFLLIFFLRRWIRGKEESHLIRDYIYWPYCNLLFPSFNPSSPYFSYLVSKLIEHV